GVIHRERNENLIFYPAYSKAKISSVYCANMDENSNKLVQMRPLTSPLTFIKKNIDRIKSKC
ncbi:hypothetical protein, partial [Enterobacter hormaechei]|uniref:hypothetical protein n=1 Tax=Enterobacter hormaechei TaxID=158836 RepID=UPI001BAEE5A8